MTHSQDPPLVDNTIPWAFSRPTHFTHTYTSSKSPFSSTSSLPTTPFALQPLPSPSPSPSPSPIPALRPDTSTPPVSSPSPSKSLTQRTFIFSGDFWPAASVRTPHKHSASIAPEVLLQHAFQPPADGFDFEDRVGAPWYAKVLYENVVGGIGDADAKVRQSGDLTTPTQNVRPPLVRSEPMTGGDSDSDNVCAPGRTSTPGDGISLHELASMMFHRHNNNGSKHGRSASESSSGGWRSFSSMCSRSGSGTGSVDSSRLSTAFSTPEDEGASGSDETVKPGFVDGSYFPPHKMMRASFESMSMSMPVTAPVPVPEPSSSAKRESMRRQVQSTPNTPAYSFTLTGEEPFGGLSSSAPSSWTPPTKSSTTSGMSTSSAPIASSSTLKPTRPPFMRSRSDPLTATKRTLALQFAGSSGSSGSQRGHAGAFFGPGGSSSSVSFPTTTQSAPAYTSAQQQQHGRSASWSQSQTRTTTHRQQQQQQQQQQKQGLDWGETGEAAVGNESCSQMRLGRRYGYGYGREDAGDQYEGGRQGHDAAYGCDCDCDYAEFGAGLGKGFELQQTRGNSRSRSRMATTTTTTTTTAATDADMNAYHRNSITNANQLRVNMGQDAASGPSCTSLSTAAVAGYEDVNESVGSDAAKTTITYSAEVPHMDLGGGNSGNRRVEDAMEDDYVVGDEVGGAVEIRCGSECECSDGGGDRWGTRLGTGTGTGEGGSGGGCDRIWSLDSGAALGLDFGSGSDGLGSGAVAEVKDSEAVGTWLARPDVSGSSCGSSALVRPTSERGTPDRPRSGSVRSTVSTSPTHMDLLSIADYSGNSIASEIVLLLSNESAAMSGIVDADTDTVTTATPGTSSDADSGGSSAIAFKERGDGVPVPPSTSRGSSFPCRAVPASVASASRKDKVKAPRICTELSSSSASSSSSPTNPRRSPFVERPGVYAYPPRGTFSASRKRKETLKGGVPDIAAVPMLDASDSSSSSSDSLSSDSSSATAGNVYVYPPRGTFRSSRTKLLRSEQVGPTSMQRRISGKERESARKSKREEEVNPTITARGEARPQGRLLEPEIDNLVLSISELDVFGAEAYKRSVDWYSSWVDEEERAWSSPCASPSSTTSLGSSSSLRTVIGAAAAGGGVRSWREVYTPSPTLMR